MLISIPTIIYLIRKVIDLKSSNLSLQSENDQLISQNRKSKDKISELETKIFQYENKETILAKYNFDYSFGFWRSKSNPEHVICNSCINKIPLIEAPLQKCHNNLYECTIKDCQQKYVKFPNSKISMGDKTITGGFKNMEF